MYKCISCPFFSRRMNGRQIHKHRTSAKNNGKKHHDLGNNHFGNYITMGQQKPKHTKSSGNWCSCAAHSLNILLKLLNVHYGCKIMTSVSVKNWFAKILEGKKVYLKNIWSIGPKLVTFCQPSFYR